ncbi:MAG: ABC transporter ATP-binding protein [Bacteroidota bacterium]
MEKTMTLTTLTVGYGSKRKPKVVSANISAELFKGELVCFLGPNGAGKSTLIRTLAGMQQPLSGEVFLQGENVHNISKGELAKKMSLVLTDRVQSGLLTAYEVVALGRYPHTSWSGKLTEADHAKVLEAIKTVGAEELALRSMAELSDGERQKIMVARALAQDPEIMILDEITAFLDLPRRIEIMQLMRKMAKEQNKCILMSTHDMELALKYADKLWLQPKNSKLVIGAPEDLILDGSFAKAFESEGIHFDMQKGAFES